MAVYLGFEGNVEAAGADAANHWLDDSDDIGRLWKGPAIEDPPAMFVSFSTLKDPAWQGPHTAEVLVPLDRSVFAPWQDRREGIRDEAYLALKGAAVERVLARFFRQFPALQPMLRFHEASTPLSQWDRVRTPEGSMYGVEMTADRLTTPVLNLRTPVPGLLLCGKDVAGPGIPAAFIGGMIAAAAIEPSLWRQMTR
jgi:all-trans-retinol 13,14-reductase